MSFNLESVGKQIAVIKNKENSKAKDRKVFLSSEDEAKNNYDRLETKGNEYFQVVKDPDSERICLYIVGASGSGKSFWTTQFVKQFKTTNKNRKIYLISPITDDKNINSLKPTRLNPESDNFIQDPPEVEDFSNSILICDDIEAYTNKHTVLRIMNLINSILTTGRHHNVSLLFLIHSPTQGNMTKLLLLESHGVVIFPQNMTGKGSKYLLDTYLGLDKDQIKKIKQMKSRAITIMKTYPMTLIAENEIINLKDF
jgi:Cdc6-like AAA superfamily ATPase